MTNKYTITFYCGANKWGLYGDSYVVYDRWKVDCDSLEDAIKKAMEYLDDESWKDHCDLGQTKTYHLVDPESFDIDGTEYQVIYHDDGTYYIQEKWKDYY